MRVLLALLAVAAGVALRSQAHVATAANPIRRIVNFLQKMQEEIEAEGKREEKLFEKFQCYCQKGAGSLQGEISDGQAQVKELTASIESKTARKEQLDGEVEQHREDRKEAQAAVDKATAIRKKEKEAFDKDSGDLDTNVAALNKAIKVLSKGMGKAFLQQPATVRALKSAYDRASGLDDMQKSVILGFIQSPYGDYQASSGEIVGILKEMQDESGRDLVAAKEAEAAAVKQFQELVAAKKAEIQAATDGIEKKIVRSGELAVEISEDKNAKANTEKEIAANNEFVAGLAKDCGTKKDEFDARVKERADEAVAVSEAIKVLNDDDALDVFKKTLPSPGASFLQLDPTPAQQAQAFVQQAADSSQDRRPALSLIAFMLRAGKVDFSKVLGMIDEMVSHLGKEQQDDDDQLAFCKAELRKSGLKKEELERNINGLGSTIDELAARMKELSEEIEKLTARIAEAEKAMADATVIREEENKNFKQSSIELNAAKQLIEKAKNRLNKFYNPGLYKPPPARELSEEERIAQNMGEVLPTEAPKYIAGTKIEQLQTAPAPAPETWEGGYKKKNSSGVTGLMDFAHQGPRNAAPDCAAG